MNSKYIKIFFNALFIIILVVFQISFIDGLPTYFNNLNLPLVTLIFILVLGGLNPAFWWSLGIGFMFDIFSFMPFGLFTICYFLTIILTHFLLINFFTNRSLYSFLTLTFFATVSYEFFILIFRHIQ